MSSLIFPYTDPDNSIISRLEGEIDFSIISVYPESVAMNLWKDVYKEIISPGRDILEKAANLDTFYRNRAENKFEPWASNGDFSIDNLGGSESVSSILNDLGQKESLNVNFEKKYISSVFFQILANRYEKEKKELGDFIDDIERREKEIFLKIQGKDTKKDSGLIKTRENNLPSETLIRNSILTWLFLFSASGKNCNELITDRMEYIDVLNELGFKLKELRSETSMTSGFETKVFKAETDINLIIYNLFPEIFKSDTMKTLEVEGFKITCI